MVGLAPLTNVLRHYLVQGSRFSRQTGRLVIRGAATLTHASRHYLIQVGDSFGREVGSTILLLVRRPGATVRFQRRRCDGDSGTIDRASKQRYIWICAFRHMST